MIQENIKQKRELFRLQIRKQNLNNEFSKKRNLNIVCNNETPIDEVLNQIFTLTQQPITEEILLNCLTLIAGHQNTTDILKNTSFLTFSIFEYFCNCQYDENTVQHFLRYFDSKLLFDDLAYLEIKQVQQEFMSNLKLTLMNNLMQNTENIVLIVNILQSLLIDCPTIFLQFLNSDIDEDQSLLQLLIEISSRQDEINSHLIEFYFHLVRFIRNEDGISQRILSQIIELYFSILSLKTNLVEIKTLPLYCKSGKYLIKLCDSEEFNISKLTKFPIFIAILLKICNLDNKVSEIDLVKYYCAKTIKHIWRCFFKIPNCIGDLYMMGMIEQLMKFIITEESKTSKIGLEILKEIIDIGLPEDLLNQILHESIKIDEKVIVFLEWLINEVESQQETHISIIISIFDEILQTNNSSLLKTLLKSKIIEKMRDMLLREFDAQIHLQIIQLLSNLITEDSDGEVKQEFDQTQIIEVVLEINKKSKNQLLVYQTENLVQLCEIQK